MHCAPTPPKNSCPRRPQCGSKRGRRKRRVIRVHDDHTRAWDERHHAPLSMKPEATAGGASIHVLDGRLRVDAGGQPWEVGAGAVIVLGDNLREPITAIEETAFLLTVAWPAGAGASQQEMTGRHL